MSDALIEFMRMGGYGAYVWTCYGAAVALKAGVFVLYARRRRALRRAMESSQTQTPLQTQSPSQTQTQTPSEAQ